MAAGIRHAVDQLTDDESAKTARRLKSWGERYMQFDQGDPLRAQSDHFLDRLWNGILFVVVTIILALQLIWVFSMFG